MLPFGFPELLAEEPLVHLQGFVGQRRHRIEHTGDQRGIPALGGERAQMRHVRVRAFAGDLHEPILLEPMGRISSSTTFAGRTSPQDANGFGDPMAEVGLNLIGPKAIRTIPDLLRYEPKFSLDLIVDVAFPNRRVQQ